MIPQPIRKRITDAIRARPEWSATNADCLKRLDISEWSHSIYATRLFGSYIVLVYFENDDTTERDFFVLDGNRVRRATTTEDEMLREYDDNNPFNDGDDYVGWTRIWSAHDDVVRK